MADLDMAIGVNLTETYFELPLGFSYNEVIFLSNLTQKLLIK